MALPFVVDVVDDIADEHRALYEEGDDGKWHLAVDGLPPADDGAAQAAAKQSRAERDAARKELRALRKELERFDGIDPDAVREMLEEAEKHKTDALKKAGDWEEHTRRLNAAAEKKLREAVEPLQQQVADYRQIIEQRTRDSAINAAVAEHQVKKDFVEAIRALFEAKARIDWSGGEVIETPDGREVSMPRAVVIQDELPVPLDSWVRDSWAKTPSAAAVIAEQPPTGGGAPGSGNGRARENPFKRGPGWNLTRQGQLMRTDRALAERLRAEAGGG